MFSSDFFKKRGNVKFYQKETCQATQMTGFQTPTRL